MTDVSRQQFAAWADGISTLFRMAEVMQQVQQQMAQRVVLMHQQAAEKIRSANSPAELMAIQSGLMVSGLQEITQYWQEVTLAGAKLQSETMNRTTAQPAAGASMANAMTPVMQAWQSLFTAPLNGAAGVSSH